MRIFVSTGVLPSLEALVGKVREALEQGYPRIKLKFRPGWDLPMVRAVREAFPEATIHVDCNSAYRLSDATFWANYADHLTAAVKRDYEAMGKAVAELGVGAQ